MSLADAVRGRVAIPGRDTTAFLLLRLAAPDVGEAVEMRYASGRWSPGAVRRGEAVCTKPPGR
jgi:predicted solute-binding protein